MRASRAALFALFVGLTACNGCRKEKRPNGPSGGLPALASNQVQASLPIPGFLDAVVSLPTGATRAMPVVVAVLGIGDTPEEQCEAWRDIVGGRAFVLCPRGAKHWVLPEEEDAGANAASPRPGLTPKAAPAPAESAPSPGETTETPSSDEPPPPSQKLSPPRMLMQVGDKPADAPKAGARPDGFYPVDIQTLDKEITAGMAALKQRYGQHVADNWVYAGFSRGAFLGASFVTLHPDKFGRAVFIEGGQSAWTPESAARFASRGGKRVLFACGQGSCVDESNPVAALLKGQKAETRVVIGQGEGHGYKKQVKEELKKNFDWVVEGDPAWEQ